MALWCPGGRQTGGGFLDFGSAAAASRDSDIATVGSAHVLKRKAEKTLLEKSGTASNNSKVTASSICARVLGQTTD